MTHGNSPAATDPAGARGSGLRRRGLRRDIPQAAVARMPGYLRALRQWDAADHPTISSQELAVLAGVSSAQLRKDLSYIGTQGRRGVGYEVADLRTSLQQTLGVGQQYPVAIVGAGHLGSALAGYAGFAGRGFPIRAIFDADSQKIGRVIAGVAVSDSAAMAQVCAEQNITIGVIATPSRAAQQVADVLAGAGVRSLLNFSPAQLVLPADVELRQVDLGLELQMLAFHELGRDSRPTPVGSRAVSLQAVRSS